MFRPVWLAVVELKRFLSDRGDLAFAIALPIALFALMYGAFGNPQTLHLTAHVVDLDAGPAAQRLLERLSAVDGVTVELHTEEQADLALDRARILSAVVIPAGFSQDLDAGRPVQIVFRQRGSGGDEGQVVANIVQGVSQQVSAEYLLRHIVRTALGDSELNESQIEAVLAANLALDPAVTVDVPAGEEAAEQQDFVILLMPGIVTMFLLFAVTMAAQSLVDERRNGTLERLLTTRLGVNELFFGKFLGGAVRAMLQATVLLVLAFAVLQPAGISALAAMLLFTLVVAAAVSALGLLLASLARTRDQGTWLAVIVTMGMTVFGGTFFQPAAGSTMDTVSRFALNKYANDGFRALLTGDDSQAVLTGVLVLAAVTVVALIAARFAFRAAEGGR